jgi:hypothetical protein
MKAVTEFPAFTLNKAIQTKAALLAEGKSPEEIQESLAQNFKLEGEKLGFFMQSIEVATTNSQNLKRVMVLRLNDGEAAPAKAVQVEQICYVPEFLIQASAAAAATAPTKGGKGGRGGRPGGKGGGGPKGSPWGLSPEEKAAKNKKQTSN